MSDLSDLIRGVFERPAEGLLVGAITILVAFVVYFLQRHDDGKPVKWPMATASLLSAAVCLIVGIAVIQNATPVRAASGQRSTEASDKTAFLKPARRAPMPVTPGTTAPGSSVTTRPIYPTRRTYRVHLTSSPHDSPPTDVELSAAFKCKDTFPSDAFVSVTQAVADRQLASMNQCLIKTGATKFAFTVEVVAGRDAASPSSSADEAVRDRAPDLTLRTYQIATRSLSNDGRITLAEFRAEQKCLSTLPSNAFRLVTQAASDGQIGILNQCLREAGQAKIKMEAQVVGTSD